MKQHLLTLFLALAASVAPLFAQSGTCGTNLTWTLSSGTLTISGTGAMTNYSYSNSPWYSYRESIKTVKIGSSVTSIGEYAFYGCSSLTSVTIPNSVTSIGSEAFRDCSSLTSVTIGNSVTSIGWWAFYLCSSLTSITIPNSVTSIGSEAFLGCSKLTSINVDASNSEYCDIGGVLFSKDKTTLVQYPTGKTATSYTIPNSVTSIGNSAFYKCSNLTSITIPNSVTSIGVGAFEYCSSLTSVTIPNSVTSIGNWAFEYCRSLTSVTIPNSVTSIGQFAFSNCSSLTSVTIPNSVTSIGDWAFYECTSLTFITIPNSVTSIGLGAFSSCTGLTSIVVENGNVKYDRRNNCNAIIETATNTLIAGCQATTIPNSVTSIGDCAFSNCSSLTSITIPNSVTSIGNSAFNNCSSLTSITISNSVTSIGKYAFQSCSSLTSITIPNSVTSIGSDAFSDCYSLTSITCEAVVSPTLGNKVFYNVDKSIPLYVPAQSIELYKAADGWKDFTNILPITSSAPATFTITFLNYDGSELQSSEVEAGTMPQYNGATPTKPADAQYTYTFAGWDKEVVAVTGDATYTAVFVSVVQCGTIETTDGITVWEDQLPYTWEGISFTTAGTETKTLQASDGCDSIVTFTLRVLYRNITLQENESSDYYTQFATDYNGVTVTTATLNRQFTQGKWATLCLPFNVNKALMMSLGLYNRVFAFRYAEKEDDSAFSIFFAPAQSIEAGKGYIVNPNAKLAAKTSFVFPNVTINTDSDTGDITALTGYNDGTNRGNLYLVGTLRTGILQGSTAGNTYLGLKDNQLYYPNTTSGTSIRAYRGFFRSDVHVNASRVRIIADGEPVSEIEVMNDEQGRMDNVHLQNNATPARKYIENGILYIRSNGVTYTAQGQRID